MLEEGPYILVAKLGEGGMAEVFKAIKKGPNGWEKPIALKRILPFLADNESFIRMLSTEARIAARLDHPNLVQIIDFFVRENTFWMALEYVPGVTLREVVREVRRRGEKIPVPAALHILGEVLKGLDFAHKRRGPEGALGIIHRDVSPQNVLISYDGLVKLSDFGIARANIEREVTSSGVLKGKHRYLAPEQIQRAELDARTDIFACGVMLYELLCAEHPFEAPTEFETMQKIVSGNMRPPKAIRPDIVEPLAEAIVRAMSVEPRLRPNDGAEMRQDLMTFQNSRWLSHGTEEVRSWMSILFPPGIRKADAPLEKTPLLSRTGTPIPAEIDPTLSLISGMADISFGETKRTTPRSRNSIAIAAALFSLLALFASWKVFAPRPELEKEAIWTSHRVAPPAVLASYQPSPVPQPTRQPIVSPGVIDVSGPKGASVFVNGKGMGKLPLRSISLSEGSYLVSVIPKGKRPRTLRLGVRNGQISFFRWKEERKKAPQ